MIGAPQKAKMAAMRASVVRTLALQSDKRCSKKGRSRIRNTLSQRFVPLDHSLAHSCRVFRAQIAAPRASQALHGNHGQAQASSAQED